MRRDFLKIKSVSWFIIRYLFRSNKTDISKKHLPLLSITAIVGIALGIMTLIVVMSVMLGFSNEISSRLKGINAQIVLSPQNNEHDLPEIESIKKNIDDDNAIISNIVVGEVVIRSFVSENILATGAELRGVDDIVYSSGIDYYYADGKSIKDGAILGSDILSTLAVHPDYADELEFIAPMADVGVTGDLVPKNIRSKLVGAFKSGIYRYDGTIAYLPKQQALSVLGLQARNEIEIRNIKSRNVNTVLKKLRHEYPNIKIRTWEEMNKRLFSALRLERFAMFAILFLTVVISSFSIAGATSMFITSKRKDLAMLQILGMNKAHAKRIYAGIGVFIGFAGTVLGVILGLLFSLLLSLYPLNLPDVYYLNKLPIDINFMFILIFAILGFIITMASALIPVRSSVSESLVNILRYE